MKLLKYSGWLDETPEVVLAAWDETSEVVLAAWDETSEVVLAAWDENSESSGCLG
jgi:hypothetical protein